MSYEKFIGIEHEFIGIEHEISQQPSCIQDGIRSPFLSVDELLMIVRNLGHLLAKAAIGFAFICSLPVPLHGQAVVLSSDPVGFNRIACPGGSDTGIGIPFHQTPVFTGESNGLPAVTGSSAVITPKGNPSFSADAFVSPPHYLRFISGALAGAWYKITANSNVNITIEIGSDDISTLSADDAFDIIPFWTLATLFPPATQEALHASSGPLSTFRESQLLLADVMSDGIQLAPDRIYFVTDSGWFQASEGFHSADDVVVEPSQVLIIRHRDGAADTEFFALNQVHLYNHSSRVQSRAEGPQDNHLALMRPIAVKLSDLDLDPTVFVDSVSTDSGDRRDELRVYDNITAALNKSGGTIFFRVGGVWHKDDGSTYPVSDDEVIPPSNALVIRKAATATGGSSAWVNTPKY